MSHWLQGLECFGKFLEQGAVKKRHFGEKSGSVTGDITLTLPKFSAGRNPTSETKDTEWCLARIWHWQWKQYLNSDLTQFGSSYRSFSGYSSKVSQSPSIRLGQSNSSYKKRTVFHIKLFCRQTAGLNFLASNLCWLKLLKAPKLANQG